VLTETSGHLTRLVESPIGLQHDSLITRIVVSNLLASPRIIRAVTVSATARNAGALPSGLQSPERRTRSHVLGATQSVYIATQLSRVGTVGGAIPVQPLVALLAVLHSCGAQPSPIRHEPSLAAVLRHRRWARNRLSFRDFLAS
jgi:hypothetical protein